LNPITHYIGKLSWRERAVLYALLIALGTLTLIAALPLDLLGPFDARDYTPLSGMSIQQPTWCAIFEPLAAPWHILSGSPDFRLAIRVTFIWIVLGATAGSHFCQLRTHPNQPVKARLIRAGKMAAAAGTVFFLWSIFSMMLPLPGWRLTVADPNAIVADLQSHTFRSHDGLVSARQNLDWHAAGGFTVAAVTDHKRPAGGLAAARYASTAPGPIPGVIPGIEVSNRQRGYLIGLGIQPDQAPLKNTKGRDRDFTARYVWYIRTIHQGAVIGMAYRVNATAIAKMAAAGVDGFEIANFGHPDTPAEVRQAILDEARARGLVLVASSDWHGWGSLSRTWTVVRHPEGATLTPQQQAEWVVQKIRNRDAADIVPVVAGYLGPPSWARAVFTPVVETVRYAAELSAVRVLSWWIWAGLMVAVVSMLVRHGLHPGRHGLCLCPRIRPFYMGNTFLWTNPL
jgi:hypothetical protein